MCVHRREMRASKVRVMEDTLLLFQAVKTLKKYISNKLAFTFRQRCDFFFLSQLISGVVNFVDIFKAYLSGQDHFYIELISTV